MNNLNQIQKMYKTSKKKGEEIITLVGENPLTKYKEENGAVRKYSKKGNGPEIISMKYESEKLGNHLDISSNYQTNNKKVILKQIKNHIEQISINAKMVNLDLLLFDIQMFHIIKQKECM